jgi:hypothetical protein
MTTTSLGFRTNPALRKITNQITVDNYLRLPHLQNSL